MREDDGRSLARAFSAAAVAKASAPSGASEHSIAPASVKANISRARAAKTIASARARAAERKAATQAISTQQVWLANAMNAVVQIQEAPRHAQLEWLNDVMADIQLISPESSWRSFSRESREILKQNLAKSNTSSFSGSPLRIAENSSRPGVPHDCSSLAVAPAQTTSLPDSSASACSSAVSSPVEAETTSGGLHGLTPDRTRSEGNDGMLKDGNEKWANLKIVLPAEAVTDANLPSLVSELSMESTSSKEEISRNCAARTVASARARAAMRRGISQTISAQQVWLRNAVEAVVQKQEATHYIQLDWLDDVMAEIQLFSPECQSPSRSAEDFFQRNLSNSSASSIPGASQTVGVDTSTPGVPLDGSRLVVSAPTEISSIRDVSRSASSLAVWSPAEGEVAFAHLPSDQMRVGSDENMHEGRNEEGRSLVTALSATAVSKASAPSGAAEHYITPASVKANISRARAAKAIASARARAAERKAASQAISTQQVWLANAMSAVVRIQEAPRHAQLEWLNDVMADIQLISPESSCQSLSPHI
ncbi:MAG: hypothetical protein SGPRY_007335 [Prymnesium sp.]